MKNFDFHRFALTFKSQLLMERNFWLRLFLIFFLVLFFMEMLMTEVGKSFTMVRIFIRCELIMPSISV